MLPPATKLQVNVFTSVCDSVHMGGLPQSVLGYHTPQTRQAPPPREQSILGDTVNERAVRILLECNLVLITLTNTIDGSSHFFQKSYNKENAALAPVADPGFRRRGGGTATPDFGAKNHHLARFLPQIDMTMKRIGPKGFGRVPRAPPKWIRQCYSAPPCHGPFILSSDKLFYIITQFKISLILASTLFTYLSV